MQKQSPKKTNPLGFLIVGGICLGVAFVMAVMIKTSPIKVDDNALEEDTQPQFQAEKISATANVGVLLDQVRPLQQTKRVVSNVTHEPEFRGTKFVQQNAKAATIEVLSFSKEEVLKDFLKQRPDRDKFIYLRLSSDQQPERFVLLTGVYKNESSAQFNLEHMQLNLPASVHPQPKSFQSYIKYVNDLGSEELSTNTAYEVKLKRVSIPKPPPVIKPVAPVPQAQPTEQKLDTDDAAKIMN